MTKNDKIVIFDQALGRRQSLDGGESGQVPMRQEDGSIIMATPPGGAGGTPSSTVVSETNFGQSSGAGSTTPYSRGDHTHGTPANPVPAHAALTTGIHGVGLSTVESVSGSQSKVDSHKVVTASVHNFDASGNAPPQAHSAALVTNGTLDGDRLPTMSSTKKGGVPATGTPANKFLRDDATWQTPPGGSDPFLAKLVLASDVATGANTTPVNLTGMVFTFEANSKYVFDMYMMVSPAAATTGCGFQIDVSVAVTAIGISFIHQLANTGTLSGGNSIADDASQGVSSGMPAAGGIYPIYGGGLLITGANGGTAQFRFRSETTAVTTCKAGSMIRVMKMA